MEHHHKTTEQLMSELQKQREEIAALERMAADLKQVQQSLVEQLRVQELISELCMEFVNLPIDAVDRNIEYALKRLVAFLGHDRTSLRQCAQRNSQLRVTHWWAAEGTRLPPEILTKDALPYVTRRLLNGKPFVFSRLDDLPNEAHTDKKWFATLGQKSALAIPLQVGGSVIGGLTFASFSSESSWPHPLIRRLETFAQIIANALHRKQMEEELSLARQQLKNVKNSKESNDMNQRCVGRLIHHPNTIVGNSEPIKKVLRLAEKVAETDATVLIMGETGTGKDLLAREIHNLSLRRDRSMVTVNCSALPSNLIESELFGRERGAFTGAYSKEIGRFELAHGATLFLDEIGELPLEVQARLHRALELGRFERLGSPKTIQVDARIIAATNRDLAEEAEVGTFRKDLYYRLNVFPMILPPLRDRLEDIPELVWAFVRECEQKLSKRVRRIPSKTMEALQDYHWPGNIRELKHAVERAMILSSGNTLNIAVPESLKTPEIKTLTMEEMEKNHILKVLEISGGRVKGNKGAAQILRINPSTLFSRMRKLGIKSAH
jgi:formate hydrogenlyase transcriptional activator